MKYFLCIFLIVTSFLSYGQEVEANQQNETIPKKVSLHSWSYPSLSNGDTHSYFDLDYKLDSQLQLELRGFYDTYMLANVSKFNFRLKKYVSNKFYIFSGLGLEIEQAKYGLKSPKAIFNYSYGVGVDVNESIFIEARQQMQINKEVHGNYTLPKVFTLTGKYKF
ncbi:hypothetical protein [Maribacter sp.]|uniref:hypothetical protein n=1 Tax=Maribacter sp. TaxID=1897614 RepID=UPI0025BD0D59|nr:hypothetical protein [Maribacter sp.]